jgi:hypothetical protein
MREGVRVRDTWEKGMDRDIRRGTKVRDMGKGMTGEGSGI